MSRVGRFVPAERSIVPDLKKVDPRSKVTQLEREAQLVRKKIPEKSFVIVLDEKGQQLTSEALAERLNSWMNQGITDVTILGGGYMGISPTLLSEAQMRLSLSSFTLPHEMARVVLLEQIYRAISMIKGLPYHK